MVDHSTTPPTAYSEYLMEAARLSLNHKNHAIRWLCSMFGDFKQRAADYTLNRVTNAIPSVVHYERSAELSTVQDALTQVRGNLFELSIKTAEDREKSDYEHTYSGDKNTIFHSSYEGQETAQLLGEIIDTREESPRIEWGISKSRDLEANEGDPGYTFEVNAGLSEGDPLTVDSRSGREYQVPGDPFRLEVRQTHISREQVDRAVGKAPPYTEIYEVSLTPEEAVELFEADSDGTDDFDIRVGANLDNKPGVKTVNAASPPQRSAGEPIWEGELRVDEEGNVELGGLEATFSIPENYEPPREDDPINLYPLASASTLIAKPLSVETEVNGEAGIDAQTAKEFLNGKRMI